MQKKGANYKGSLAIAIGNQEQKIDSKMLLIAFQIC